MTTPERITTADGLDLALHAWEVADPRVVVALVHGYAEHAGRYAHVARAFNERGISVFGLDLRGHGRSEGARGFVDRFSDYHQDLFALLDVARKRGRPIVLFGHSMGALAACHYVVSGQGGELSGLALTSPFLGLSLPVSPVKRALGRALSRVAPGTTLPSGLSGADVSRDPEMARRYDEDPLNNRGANARWFTEAMAAIELVHERAGEIRMPLLLLYGGDDRVASADATDRFAGRLSGADQTSRRLDRHFHELVNEPEPDRGRVIETLASWILGRAEARAA